MGQHGALRPAGGAAGVEQPGEVVRPALDGGRDRLVLEERGVSRAADDDEPLERRRRVRGKIALELGRGEAELCAGVLEHVAELGPMQLRVRRHGRKARPPQAVEDLDVFRAVLGDDGDALARREAELSAQRRGEARGPRGKLGIGANDAAAVTDGGAVRVGFARALEPKRDVHGPSPR